MDCIKGTETDAKKISKAKTKIILLLDPVNYVHVQDCETAKQVWDKLTETFENSGLCRRVSLLRSLLTTRSEDCGGVREFRHINRSEIEWNWIQSGRRMDWYIIIGRITLTVWSNDNGDRKLRSENYWRFYQDQAIAGCG